MLGFKDFGCACIILSGIEVMHMISQGTDEMGCKIKPCAARQFYSLVM
jgi:putative transposase